VAFLDGTKAIRHCGAVEIAPSGVATCVATFASPGTPNVTAHFAGDKFDQSSTSAPLSLAVAADPSATTLNPSANPTPAGQNVRFTAVVASPEGGTPTGTVTFSVGGQPIAGCSAKKLSHAAATCTTQFSSIGFQYSVTVEADYSGSSVVAPSSTTVDESVNP
jgi:hypothetical protein